MKNKIILVVSSLFLLASCGGSNVTASSIDTATATAALKKAMEAETASDALGFKASASFSADFDVTTPVMGGMDTPILMADGGETSTGTHIKGSASLSDASLEVMASGLSSSKLEDLKASAVAAASLKYNVEGVSTSAVTGDYSGMKAAAYLENGNVYADLSNAKAVEFGNMVATLASTFSGNTPVAMTAGKYVYSNLVKATSLPILSEKVKTSISEDVDNTMKQLETYKDYFQTVSYSDGTFGLNASLSKTDLVALVGTIAVKNASSSSTDNSTAKIAASLIQFLNLNACELKITFGEKGLISSSSKLDLSVDTNLGAIYGAIAGTSVSLPSEYTSVVEKLSVKYESSVNFLSGTDVKVLAPTASEYTAASTSAPVEA
jgi:hypothetical protein